MDIFFDTYSGYGLSLSLSPKANLELADNLGGSLGVSAGLNTQQGTTVNANLGFNVGLRNLNPSYGASYSSRTGLESAYWGHGQVPLFAPSYLAASQRSQWGARKDFSVRLGPELQGVFPYAGVKAYFSETAFTMPKTKWAFGFLHLHEGVPATIDAQLDFVREKDSPLKPKTPTLPFTVLAADEFNLALPVGPSGAFRAFRNDLPVVGDSTVSGANVSASLDGEAGIGSVAHAGVSEQGAVALSESSGWFDNEFAKRARDGATFPPTTTGERSYFALLSELTTELVNTTKKHPGEPRFVSLAGTNKADWSIQGLTGAQEPPVSPKDRRSRATYIRAVTELEARQTAWKAKFCHRSIARPKIEGETQSDCGGEPPQANGIIVSGEQIAGFEVVATDGIRYVFAQPAYVRHEINCTFSVDPRRDDSMKAVFLPGQSIISVPERTARLIGQWFADPSVGISGLEAALPDTTDQFLSCTSTPAFAHSYHLTSVLGSGYFDSDGVEGPSEGDLGHWVRFEYEAARDYVYRSPYEGAHYHRGYENSYLGDDRGSVTIGRKELFFLKRAVTASHELKLDLKPRADGLGARVDPSNNRTQLKRIESISLYRLGDEQNPIKTVTLGRNYELAKGIPNTDPSIDPVNGADPVTDVQDGKLTLKKLWFTHGKDLSGTWSPYTFAYGSATTENPNYQEVNTSGTNERRRGDSNADRWGYYQRCKGIASYSELGASNDRCSNGESPYTSQASTPENRPVADANVAAWSLRSIVTPSGARIDVSYEADDYAYVQGEKAAVMMPGCETAAASIVVEDSNPRLCIDLSRSGTGRADAPKTIEEASTFIDHLLNGAGGPATQLAYVADVRLRRDGPNGEMWQTITGYVEVGGDAYPTCTANGCSMNILLKPVQVKGRSYHPFAVAAWQHLKLNQPQYGVPGVSPMSVYNADREQLKEASLGLVNMVLHVHDTFENYAERAKAAEWGNMVRNVRVRLFEPRGIKHGGGARVSRVTLCNSTAGPNVNCNDPRYAIGQSYEYRIQEDGRKISSGVAAYEPSLGGDEISLRRAEFFSEHRILAPNDPAYFEHPVAESMFPAPVVGYRRVVERTLAGEYARRNTKMREDFRTQLQAQELSSEEIARRLNLDYPPVATAGERVHEFYTAKDFPVRIQASIIQKPSPVQSVLQMPGIGTLLEEKFAASQGYRVEVNDMHGKPRRVTEYALKPDGFRAEGADSETTYLYNVASGTVDRLDPRSPAFYDPGRGRLGHRIQHFVYPLDEQPRGSLGQRVEYYADMRQSFSSMSSRGLSVNVDTILALFPIPIPVPWPSYDDSVKESRTSVFHQIVHQNGVLVGIETRDRGSLRAISNLVFDPMNGEPVLTAHTNAFGDPEYTFAVPAYWLQPKMGPAFVEDSNQNLLAAEAIQLRSAKDPLTVPPFRCDVEKSPLFRSVEDVLDVSLTLHWNHGLLDTDLLYRHARTDIASSIIQHGGMWAPIATYRFEAKRTNQDKPLSRIDGRYDKAVVIPVSKLPAEAIRDFETWVAACSPWWRQMERIRKYHPRGPPIEASTPLDRFDAVLYSQKAAFVNAVAKNAAYWQIGYEGFESYAAGRKLSSEQLDDGNIDFSAEAAAARGPSIGTVVSGVRIENGTLVVEQIPLPPSFLRDVANWTLPINAQVRLGSDDGEPLCRDVQVLDLRQSNRRWTARVDTALQATGRKAEVEFFAPSAESRSRASTSITPSSSARLARCPQIEITGNVAHTGSRALAVHKTTTFQQSRLKLPPGRNVLSAWVSRWNADVPTFSSPASALGEDRRGIAVDVSGVKALFEPTGPVIDGWQRVEGEFYVPSVTATLSLSVQPGPDGVLYVDDIRVHPRDALMQTFVYEPRLKQLIARHDENNMAMRWQYDQAGQLRMSERETERGWRTVTEQMSHQAEYK